MADSPKPGTVPVPHLRAWRESRYLTRATLAQLADLSEPTIEKLEMGRAIGARFSTVLKLAQALGITPDQLIYQTPPPL